MADDFFVNIENPLALRRSVLETSKEAIKSLQTFEIFKDTRIKKVELIAELKHIMDELNRLGSQLNSVLPGSSFRRTERGEKDRKAVIKKKEKVEKESDLDKLEKELASIEGKLGKLD